MFFADGLTEHRVRLGYMVELLPEQYNEVARCAVKWIPISNTE